MLTKLKLIVCACKSIISSHKTLPEKWIRKFRINLIYKKNRQIDHGAGSMSTSLNSQGGPSLLAPPTSTTSTVGYSSNSTASTTKESHHLLNKVAAAMPLLPPLPTASTTTEQGNLLKGIVNKTVTHQEISGIFQPYSCFYWEYNLTIFAILIPKCCKYPILGSKTNRLYFRTYEKKLLDGDAVEIFDI